MTWADLSPLPTPKLKISGAAGQLYLLTRLYRAILNQYNLTRTVEKLESNSP